jgi:hypothetical protein
MMIAMGFFLFGLAVKYLPIFAAETEHNVDEPRVGVAPALSHAGD